jgi:hypothetical protein
MGRTILSLPVPTDKPRKETDPRQVVGQQKKCREPRTTHGWNTDETRWKGKSRFHEYKETRNTGSGRGNLTESSLGNLSCQALDQRSVVGIVTFRRKVR